MWVMLTIPLSCNACLSVWVCCQPRLVLSAQALVSTSPCSVSCLGSSDTPGNAFWERAFGEDWIPCHRARLGVPALIPPGKVMVQGLRSLLPTWPIWTETPPPGCPGPTLAIAGIWMEWQCTLPLSF